jgi:hypothetical protein
MKLDREARRTMVQFLNGLAVALIAGFVLAPAATGSLEVPVAGFGLVGAVLLHAAALRLSR